MRNVVNISLPVELNYEVARAVDEGRFATKSEFFRHLLRLWFEGRLASELKESHKEMASGKRRLLRSFKDLR